MESTVKWALVTGASRGIGRSICLSLAESGFSIIMIARSEEQLNKLKLEILEKNVKCEILPMDFSHVDAAAQLFKAIQYYLPQLEIVCLNACKVVYGPFDKVPLHVHEQSIQMNILFPTQFIFLVLDYLNSVQFKSSQKNFFFFSISSQAAYMPIPWLSKYAAEKAYLNQLSLSLFEEYADSPIHFITLVPPATETSIYETLGVPNELKMKMPKGKSPDEVGNLILSILKSKDKLKPLYTNIPGFRFFRMFVGMMSFSYLLKMAGKMFSIFKSKGYW